MKLLTFLIIALFATHGAFAQGILEIKKTEINLKDLPADNQPITETFEIKNSGNQPIIITRVTPMTSLYKADWTHEPIAPGKKGEIRISFTPMQMPEKFNYRILVFSNARTTRTELVMSGNIIDNPKKPQLLYKYDMDGLKLKKNNVNFNTIYTWQNLSDTLYCYNTRPEAVHLSVQYQAAHIQTTFLPEKLEPGQQGKIIISFDASKKNDYGYTYESLILSLNNSRDYKYRLTVTADIQEDFSKLSKKQLEDSPVATFDKSEVNFGEIKQGTKTNCDFTLTNTGKSDLFIRKTRASCGCTAVTLGDKVITPGSKTTIRATFDSTGKTGRQYKTITVITNDPKHPSTLLTINGDVKKD